MLPSLSSVPIAYPAAAAAATAAAAAAAGLQPNIMSPTGAVLKGKGARSPIQRSAPTVQ